MRFDAHLHPWELARYTPLELQALYTEAERRDAAMREVGE